MVVRGGGRITVNCEVAGLFPFGQPDSLEDGPGDCLVTCAISLGQPPSVCKLATALPYVQEATGKFSVK